MSSGVETPTRGTEIISDSQIRGYMKVFGGLTYTRDRSGGRAAVVIVPDAPKPFVIKSPYESKSLGDTERLVSNYEACILRLLKDSDRSSPVVLPYLLGRNHSRTSVVVDYIPGITLTDDQVDRMTIPEKNALGKNIARFVNWMAEAIPQDNKIFQLNYNSAARPYDRRNTVVAKWRVLPDELDYVGQHELAGLTSDLFKEYLSLKKEGKIKDRYIVGHNDLKPSNWVFGYDERGNFDLLSVVDFGEALLTTPEQEFRRLPLLGDTVLYSAIKEYRRLTGITLDENVIRFWSKVHFIDFANNIALGKGSRKQLPFLLTQLRRLYPDFDPRELTGEITYQHGKQKL